MSLRTKWLLTGLAATLLAVASIVMCMVAIFSNLHFLYYWVAVCWLLMTVSVGFSAYYDKQSGWQSMYGK